MKISPAASPMVAHMKSPGVLAGMVMLIAVAVRFWQLDFHSFWFDEAVSLRWATSDISFIWEKTFPLVEEKHPPGYYILLHLWLRVLDWFGLAQVDSAIRGLGALLGVIGVGAVMSLAWQLGGRATGLLTGLLVALSPLLIWYSHEARMFQPATTGIMLGAFALWRAWQTPKVGLRLLWWLAFTGGLLFALYSYLFSAFIMPAAGLSLLLLYRVAPDRRKFVEGFLALAVVTALFLPLAQNAWGVNAAESTPGQAFGNFIDNHLRLLQVFTVWRVVWPTWLLNGVLILWGSLLLLGMFPIAPKHKPPTALQPDPADATAPTRLQIQQPNLTVYWLWLWLGLPILIANVLLSRSGSIFNEDRYLIFLAPFALWAAAQGALMIAAYFQRVGSALALGLLLSLIVALPQIWSVENYRENWRAAAQYIIDYENATPHLSAAGVSHIFYTNEPLQWYLRQAFTHEELPVFFPFGDWIDPNRIEEDVAPPLRGIEELGVDTLWLVQSHTEQVDPHRLVEGWLQSTYPIVTELYPAGIKVTGHSLRAEYDAFPGELVQGESSAGVAPLDSPIEVAPGLFLHQCFPVFPQVAARDQLYHPPSGWVHLQSWWSRAESDELLASPNWEHDLRLAARVVAPDAVWGESLDRAADVFRVQPPATWTPGAWVRVETDINLNPLVPAGLYDVTIRVEVQSEPDGPIEEFSAPCGQVYITN